MTMITLTERLLKLLDRGGLFVYHHVIVDITTLHGTGGSCVVTALVISTVLAELVILCEEVC